MAEVFVGVGATKDDECGLELVHALSYSAWLLEEIEIVFLDYLANPVLLQALVLRALRPCLSIVNSNPLKVVTYFDHL